MPVETPAETPSDEAAVQMPPVPPPPRSTVTFVAPNGLNLPAIVESYSDENGHAVLRAAKPLHRDAVPLGQPVPYNAERGKGSWHYAQEPVAPEAVAEPVTEPVATEPATPASQPAPEAQPVRSRFAPSTPPVVEAPPAQEPA